MTGGPEFPARKSSTILALLFAILFLGVVDNQIVLPILTLIAATFNCSVSEIGWAITAYAFSAAAMSLLFGPFSDHFGRKPILLFGLSGFGVCAYLLSIVPTFSTFFVLRALMGAFAGVLSTCVTAYVGDYFPYAVRGRAMGVVITSYFAAIVFGVPIGAFIADHWDWHWIFTITALLAVVLIFTTAQILPRPDRGAQALETGGGKAHREWLRQSAGKFRIGSGQRREPSLSRVGWSTPEYFSRYRHFLSSPQELAVLVSGAFVSGATLVLLTFVSPWLMGDFGLTATRVGLVFVIVGAASMLASPLSGWASDYVGKRRLFLISSFLSACLTALLPWSGQPKRLVILFFAVALTIAFRQTSQQTLVTELIPTRGRGGFIALRNCFSQVGIGVSVFIASPLFARYGFKGVALFSAAQSMLAACLFLRVQEPKNTIDFGREWHR